VTIPGAFPVSSAAIVSDVVLLPKKASAVDHDHTERLEEKPPEAPLTVSTKEGTSLINAIYSSNDFSINECVFCRPIFVFLHLRAFCCDFMYVVENFCCRLA